MSERITFQDGGAYERGMGAWSKLVVRDKLPPAADGSVSYAARANAIAGRVPAG